MVREFEESTKRCPECDGAMEFEVDVDPVLGGGDPDRTPIGYNCLDAACGKRIFP